MTYPPARTPTLFDDDDADDYDESLPFGRRAEQERLASLRETENETSWISKLQEQRRLEREAEKNNRRD